MILLTTFLIMVVVGLIPLIAYALTKCGTDFNLLTWVVTSRDRLILGFVLIGLFSVLIVYVPEAAEILAAVGFNTAKPAALALAIGTSLVTLIRGNEK